MEKSLLQGVTIQVYYTNKGTVSVLTSKDKECLVSTPYRYNNHEAPE